MAISIQNLLRDGRVDKDATQDIYHLDEAKAPDIITAIKSGDVLLADGHIYVLISIDGTREIVIGNSSDTYDSAFKIAGTSGEPVVVTWEEIDGKPETFTPSAHTHNASDIDAGVLNIARIPTGTTATTVALGNHTQAFTTITGVATTAQIPSLPTSKITSGTFAIAQTNSVLAGLGAGTNEAVTATDTLLQAIAKLQAQITALVTP